MLPSTASLGMEQKELDLLRMQLDKTSSELAACKDDLAEAYAMLARAGLDWAKERQQKGALEATLEEVTSECRKLRAERDELTSALRRAQLDCHAYKLQAEMRCATGAEDAMIEETILRNCDGGVQGEGDGGVGSNGMGGGVLDGKPLNSGREGFAKKGSEWEVVTQQHAVLTQQVEEAQKGLAEEQQRRQRLEDAITSVLNVVAEAKQESEREREKAQNFENVAATVLKWAAGERDALAADRDRLAQERKELDLAHRWREYSLRLKLQEGHMELMGQLERLEFLERNINLRLEAMGLSSLWSEAEESFVRGTFESLRQQEQLGEEAQEHSSPGDTEAMDTDTAVAVAVPPEKKVEAPRTGLTVPVSAVARRVLRRIQHGAALSSEGGSSVPAAGPGLGAELKRSKSGPSLEAWQEQELEEQTKSRAEEGGEGGSGGRGGEDQRITERGSATLVGGLDGCAKSAGPEMTLSRPGSKAMPVSHWSPPDVSRGGRARENVDFFPTNSGMGKSDVDMLSRKLPEKLQLHVEGQQQGQEEEEEEEPMAFEPLSCSSTRSDAPSMLSSEFPFDSCSEESFRVKPSTSLKPVFRALPAGKPAVEQPGRLQHTKSQLSGPQHMQLGETIASDKGRSRTGSKPVDFSGKPSPQMAQKRVLKDLYPVAQGSGPPSLKARQLREKTAH